jgi:dihydroorotate dehydrogenase electron transfer subunit
MISDNTKKKNPGVFQKKCKVISNQFISDGYYILKIASREISQLAQPGMFVSIKVNELTDPMLRRPFSFYDVSEKKDNFSILYQVVGKGTKILSEKKEDDLIDVIGPLGNGFNIPSSINNIAITAGGIGSAPLIYLARELNKKKKNIYFLLGLKKRSFYNFIKNALGFINPLNFLAVIEDELPTDDLNVVKVLEKFMVDTDIEYIAACGPSGMIREMHKLKYPESIKVFVSYENHFSCSIGVCHGCSIRVYNAKNKLENKRVCKDGPVFELNKLVF